MTSRRVVITGMGVVCPVGNNAAETWQALVIGQSGIATISAFDPSDLKVRIAGEVKNFDPVAMFGPREARRMDRFTHLALAATQEAMADSGLVVTPENAHRIGSIIGSGIGGVGTLIDETLKAVEKGEQWASPHMVPMILPDTAPGKIAIEYGLRGPNMSIATACASSTNALGEATETIRRGAADVMVTGGAEAGILKLVIAAFNNMGALSQRNDDPQAASRPFDRDRDGFVAGEGAAILILESEESAKARGARIYAEMLGYGASADAFHVTAPAENGEGAVLAMQQALATAGVEPFQVDYLNAHGTSTELNDRSETLAIKQVFGDGAYDVAISSTKSMTGHLMGAAGALEAFACVMAIQDGCVPPTINHDNPGEGLDLDYVPNQARSMDVRIAMSNSFGFGGHNASIVLGRYDG